MAERGGNGEPLPVGEGMALCQYTKNRECVVHCQVTRGTYGVHLCKNLHIKKITEFCLFPMTYVAGGADWGASGKVAVGGVTSNGGKLLPYPQMSSLKT
jgi:hypothetical protein